MPERTIVLFQDNTEGGSNSNYSNPKVVENSNKRKFPHLDECERDLNIISYRLETIKKINDELFPQLREAQKKAEAFGTTWDHLSLAE